METSKFDIADYLDSNEMIAEYLNAVLAEGNNADVITAIGHIAKSIGMTKIAQETGLSRPSLYKALSDGAKPQFETIMKVLRAIGGQIQINPDSLRKNAPQQAVEVIGFCTATRRQLHIPPNVVLNTKHLATWIQK